MAYVRVHAAKRKDGSERYTGYAHPDRKRNFCVGTFDSPERAQIAGKIFLFWYARYPLMNPHRIKNNFFTDAI